MTGPVGRRLARSEQSREFTATGSPRFGYALDSPISGSPEPLKTTNALSSNAGDSALAHLQDGEG